MDSTEGKPPVKAEKGGQAMKQIAKDTLTAAVIGVLGTYLPFWQWGGTLPQAVGALVLGIPAWCALVAMEPEPKKGS